MKKSFLIFLTLLLVIVAFSPSIKADWSFDNDGNIISGSTSKVLGEKDENREKRKELERKQPETRRIESEKALEIRKNSFEKEKLIMKKDDIKKIEIENDKDNLQMKATDKKGEIKKQDQKEFEMQKGDEQIKISTENNKTSFKMKTRGSEVEIKTDSPLSIDPTTKELTVKTPAGEKTVTILPNKASEIISKLGVIDNPSKSTNMKLETEDNKLVYKIAGLKQKKLFGFVPITLQKEAVVSAETGSVIKTNQTFFSSVLNFLSF